MRSLFIGVSHDARALLTDHASGGAMEDRAGEEATNGAAREVISASPGSNRVGARGDPEAASHRERARDRTWDAGVILVLAGSGTAAGLPRTICVRSSRIGRGDRRLPQRSAVAPVGLSDAARSGLLASMGSANRGSICALGYVPPKLRRATLLQPRCEPRPPHPNQNVSGKPGPVHAIRGRHSSGAMRRRWQ